MEIEQVLLPQLMEDDPVFQIMPIENADASTLKWDQLDNFLGLQQARGMNGNPSRVVKTGSKQYEMRPGYYGEYELIDEEELTERRKLGTFGTPVSIDDLVGVAQRKLLQRRLDRIRYICWTLLTSGTFTVAAPHGGYIHADTFALNSSTASPLWSSTTTAAPVDFLRTVVLNQRGQSVNFGRGAKIYMNRGSVNNLLKNSNSADIGGKYRIGGGNTPVNLEDINRILDANDLPSIIEYDRGYLNDAGTFTNFIPDGKAVLIGQRPSGARLGEYRMTRNANNPDLAPGPYTAIFDRGETTVPRQIEVHDGHNGGPVIFFPGSIRILNI